ncbi:MAG: EAL domain-containing protein [Massilia sp.]
METPKDPVDENARMAALQALLILDSGPEQAFDALTELAALSCAAPIALLCLVDHERQWFKATSGLFGMTETPRAISICAHAILQDEILEVTDTTHDPRFADNPLVTGAPHIRFYAGMPVTVMDGQRVGTLCVIDHVARELTDTERLVLQRLAYLAGAALEGRRAKLLVRQAYDEAQASAARLLNLSASERVAHEKQLRRNERFLKRTERLAGVGSWSFEVGQDSVYWSDETAILHGLPAGYQPALGEAISYYAEDARPLITAAIEHCMRSGEGWDLELPLVRVDGARSFVRAVGAADMVDGRVVRLFGTFQDVTAGVSERIDLALSRARVMMATDAGEIGVFDLDLASGVQTWDKRMFKLYGIDSEEGQVPPDYWLNFLHPDDRARAERASHATFTEDRSFDVEFRVIHADQSVHLLRGNARVLRDARGRAVHMVGTTVDITEERRLQAALADQNELLRVTLQSITDAVITTDVEGTIRWLNPVAERMTGWRSEEACGMALASVYRVIKQDTRLAAENPAAICLAAGDVVQADDQSLLIARDGSEYGIEDSAAPIRNGAGMIIGVVLVFHDVTAQRALSCEMRHRASHDALTGLANRAEFEARLLRLVHDAHIDHGEHALLFIDLDQFKLVNDACGHAAGDELLRQVARLLAEGIRSRDTLARLGGDEFAIILEKCQPEQAARAAQAICDRMETFRYAHEGRRFRIGASIGLVPLDKRWKSAEAVLLAADTACYAAKEAGRNRVHVWFDTDSAMQLRQGQMQWTTRIEHALDHDRFVLYAQRIVAVTPGSGVARAEILLRMLDDDGVGLILPGAFLPAAERFHLASRIDRWVLKNVVAWMQAGTGLAETGELSINLSGQSVGDRAFQRWAVDLFTAAGAAVCKGLCIEITETAAVTNLQDAASFIDILRALGIRIALDDFGAGASSFGYLKNLPVDYLKIDGQFVRNLLSHKLDEATVRSFVDVASVMGVPTVAECVESEDVLACLKAIGIDFAQGFLLHRPAPIDQLRERVREAQVSMA